MENRRRCETCIFDVHRASMQKHLRSKKHFEKEKQNELIITDWSFKEDQAPITNKVKEIYNPETIKQIARKSIKINDKELNKELA